MLKGANDLDDDAVADSGRSVEVFRVADYGLPDGDIVRLYCYQARSLR